MITGELKSKIDRIWDAMWAGGIANPLTVIEQLTYLLFFAAIVESVERQKARQLAHLAELDALFAALQHRAFRGEL